MSQYKITINNYDFQCPGCKGNISMPYNVKGIINYYCPACRSELIIDTSQLELYYPNAEKVFQTAIEDFELQGFKRAFRYFSAAAECNHPEAMYYLGTMYNKGLGVDENEEKALYWLHKAADMNSIKAAYRLGHVYSTENYKCYDTAKATKYYMIAAKKGYVYAMYYTGIMLAEEDNPLRDLNEAVSWLKKAGDNGMADSYEQIGCIFEANLKDLHTAFKWYECAAQNGSTAGQFQAGRLLFNGPIVGDGSFEIVDYDTAFKYYWDAAHGGNMDAMTDLGKCYEEGKGTDKNLDVAVKWYVRAAELGEFFAHYHLAVLLFKCRNIDGAYYWENKAYNDFPERRNLIEDTYRRITEVYNLMHGYGE